MKKLLWCLLLSLLMYSAHSQNCSCGSGNIGAFASNTGDDNINNLLKNTVVMDVMYDYRTFTPFTNKELEKMFSHNSDVIGVSNAWILPLKLTYGFNEKLSVSIIQPYISISTIVNQKLGEDGYNSFYSSNTNSFADLSVLSNYLIVKKNGIKLSAMIGIELPTGKLPKDQAVIITGSGSFDPILGLNVSKNWKRYSLKGNLAYKYTTNNTSGMDYGDFLNHQITFVYQLNQTKADSTNTGCSVSKKPTYSLGGSLIGENLHPISSNNVEIKNTGYYRHFASLNAAISFKQRYVISAAFDLPIIQNNYGTQNAASYRFRFGASIKIH